MFAFPEEARWSEEEDAVEFTLRLGEYEGKVFVPRRVMQSLLGRRADAEECVRQFHLNRTAFERIAEARVRARQLDADAHIRITGRDLRRAGRG
ncbi:MAG TPA: DUF1488 family protein [Stellaceae bacterium]|nr:DUF1488 family protein [Stellaceae bacterium]